MRKTLIATGGMIVTAALAGPAAIAATSKSFEGQVKDAWLTGRIETMYLLNEHLNPFEISTEVENGVVYLTGIVDSDVGRDLAGALAKNVDGVVEVENNLVVEASSATASADNDANRAARRDFGSWVDDATTTAAVKTRLIANANTKGLEIDVDTMNDVVILSGRVSTDEEKALAEQIALRTKDVAEVRNNLVVDPE